MRKKLCYIVSNVQKSLAFEWTAMRLRDNYDLLFILLNPGPSLLEGFLSANGIRVIRISYHGKKSLIPALWRTYRILRNERPLVVHAHLLDAQLVGLTASWMARTPKRIYTRHNSNFHHVYHPRGVRYDRWSNRLATHIISISQATDYTLKNLENVRAEKIRRIPHGFDFSALTNVPEDRVLNVRSKWKIGAQRLVVGVIARQIEWKGIQYIIPAFADFARKHSNALLVLANAGGPYHDAITQELERLNVDQFIQVPFEDDVAALYRTFSMYVHTPVDPIVEAFGQTYVEALAAGVPSIFTLSGIAPEFIKDNGNALVVDFKNSDAICRAMLRIAGDQALRQQLIEKGKEDVLLRFDISKMTRLLEQLYDE